MTFLLQHFHPSLGWVDHQAEYTDYELALTYKNSYEKHTGKLFQIIPMQLTIPIEHRSQKQKIKDWLLAGKSIDRENVYEAIGEWCMLAQRIDELEKKDGMQGLIDAPIVPAKRRGIKAVYSMSPASIAIYNEKGVKQLQSPVQTKEAA